MCFVFVMPVCKLQLQIFSTRSPSILVTNVWVVGLVICHISRHDGCSCPWGNVSAPGARRASFLTRALPVDCCC